MTCRPGHRLRAWGAAPILAAVLVLGLGRPAHADDDHERARMAVARGEALPLEQILKKLRRAVPGEVIEVEFEREKRRWTYEIKVIDRHGVIREVEMDAATGEILEVEVDSR